MIYTISAQPKAYSPKAEPEPLKLHEAQAIAEGIVGPTQWNGGEGFCQCPGEDLHTTRTAATDCKVVCEPVPKSGGILKPGIYCFHDGCRHAVEPLSHQLRSALGKRSPQNRAPAVRLPALRKPEPEFNPEKLAQVAAKMSGVDPAWLAARSPIRPDTRRPASFLAALYEPGEKVVVFDVYKSQGQHVWTAKEPPYNATELDSFRQGKRCGVWYLTNPVDGEFRTCDQGTPSRRSWQNVTSWRYMVVESDKADSQHWLAALVQMPLRISAIYTSGSKSIHALVRLDAASKAQWDERCSAMKPTLITLGADPKALSAVRLSRLPCCERLGTTAKDGTYIQFPRPQQQMLLYLNSSPDPKPICEMPVLLPKQVVERGVQ